MLAGLRIFRPVPVLALLALLVFGLGAGAARADRLRDHALTLFAPLPARIDSLHGEPVTPEKVQLGWQMFFDPRLSDSGQFACATCHNPATGGDDNRATAIGHLWQDGPQNAPTIFNATLNTARFWQGWSEDLRREREWLLETAAERTGSPERVVGVLRSMPDYVQGFTAAFPGQADPVTYANFARALAAYETTLLTPAPFDDWLRGDDAALSPAAREGLALFIDTGCANCHQGVNLGGGDYYPFRVVRVPGTEGQAEDLSCFAVEDDAEGAYLFRAGTLRNIARTAPYFSEGAVWSLPLAVRLMGRSQLGVELTDAEVDSLLAFLDSLTGRVPDIRLPVLPVETATTPAPQPGPGVGRP
ncbi:MAG: cytochrome-c peroxidase [Pseudomonadota bacterium]